MKFDFTKGQPAKYMVSIYEPDGSHDKLYYHYFREAKRKVNWLKENESYEKGTIISLYDMQKDARKEFVRI